MTAKPRRLLFVITSSDTGGAESALRELALRLDRRRFEPLVCSLRPTGRAADVIAEAGIPVFSLQMAERPRIFQLIGGAVRLSRILDRLEIDLVQSLLYRANVLASISVRLCSRDPILITSQRSLEPMAGRLPAWSARWTRRLSRRVIAVSQAVRDALVLGERLDPARVEIIPNGVDTEHFRRRNGPALPGLVGLADGEAVVGAAGRLTRVKGFDCLLRAAHRLHQGGLRMRLLIAGEGPERANLEDLASQLGIGARTHFLGLCENMGEFYSTLDIFVLSSLREGSPNVLLEAMACGCAVVATNVGGVPEIIEDRASGLLVPPGDEERLAIALSRLVTGSERRQRLSAQARGRIESRFSLERTVAAYERLYSSLLDESPTNRCEP